MVNENDSSGNSTINGTNSGTDNPVRKSHKRKAAAPQPAAEDLAGAGTQSTQLDPSQIAIESVNVAPFTPAEIKGVSDVAAQTITATALVILTLLDGLAVTSLGEVAHMRDYEKLMITPPLEATLKEFKIGDVPSKYLNVTLLGIGLMGWLMRVRREAGAPAPKQTSTSTSTKQPAPEQPAPENNNGRGQPEDLGKLTAAPADITDLMRTERL